MCMKTAGSICDTLKGNKEWAWEQYLQYLHLSLVTPTPAAKAQQSEPMMIYDDPVKCNDGFF